MVFLTWSNIVKTNDLKKRECAKVFVHPEKMKKTTDNKAEMDFVKKAKDCYTDASVCIEVINNHATQLNKKVQMYIICYENTGGCETDAIKHVLQNYESQKDTDLRSEFVDAIGPDVDLILEI